MRIFRCAIAPVFAGLMQLATLHEVANASSISEYDLKAAYIYNFAIFTDWPPAHLPEDTALSVCAHSENPLHDALGRMVSKGVKGRPLQVKSWGDAQPPQGCHILVLEDGDREQWSAMREDTGTVGMLSIADSEAGLAGVIITLVLDDGRLKFRVDAAAARRAELVLSAKLLRLAETIR